MDSGDGSATDTSSPRPPPHNERTPEDEQARLALAEEFGGRWSIVVSSERRWWAFCRPMTSERFTPWVDLEADTAEELRAKMRAAGEADGDGR